LLDGFGLEILSEGFADEGREFVVRGEAKGNELLNAEVVDVCALFGGKKRVEAEALFESDEAVLNLKGAVARTAGDYEEDKGHDDPPEKKNPVLRPVVDGDVDGEDEVKQQHGQDEEVKRWIDAAVVLKILRGRH
jgi:hypothetical protein